jgi:hypothetical protein
MKAPLKIGMYVVALAAIFGVSYVAAAALVPDAVAADWTARASASTAAHGGEHGDATIDPAVAGAPALPGLAGEQQGYQLRDLTAPTVVGEQGVLSFRLTGPDGAGVTEYEVAHEKELHLIVVRTDGAQFRHVHPADDGDGRWSFPWQWDTGGSYRLFADFVPTRLGADLTLTTSVTVSGEVSPRPAVSDTIDDAGAFTVRLTGSLISGEQSALTFDVARDGEPVTSLEPYLGAFGHLVALRDGDLAYLHVHPVGEPGDGVTAAGPQVRFMAQFPTEGNYLLYLDFQVDGQVHTAEFEVSATAPVDPGPPDGHPDSGH